MPEVSAPEQLTLQAEFIKGGERTRNSWHLWSFPADPWQEIEAVSLNDPEARLAGLADLVITTDALAPPGVLLTTSWNEHAEVFVRGGGRAILLAAGGQRAEPFKVMPMPFWREGVKVIEPHPAWGDFPHEGWTALQFYGMATDLTLDTTSTPGCRPILRRLDARTMAVHDYAAEFPLGKGRLIVSTLRFEGGLGHQPVGIKRNIAAAYLLSCWVRYLQERGLDRQLHPLRSCAGVNLGASE